MCMRRGWSIVFRQPTIMAHQPPRKAPSSRRVHSTSRKLSKRDAPPLQTLIQMGYTKNRALKALAATGNRSIQLASDWLLAHANDSHVDEQLPREYIFYATPTGPLLLKLQEFWENSKQTCGWNGAHNFPPHITLVSFFKAPDDVSFQIGKAAKHVLENIAGPPPGSVKLEPYISTNFMGLFVSGPHANYLKTVAGQFIKRISYLLQTKLEECVKSSHLTLAYQFDVSAFETLKAMVEGLQLPEQSSWELRLYSRDRRFLHHQVHKVTRNYKPNASHELELVLGDFIYIEKKLLDSPHDGWVQGTSWLTGVSGSLPLVHTRRTAESDAWTLHRVLSLDTYKKMSTKYPHEDAAKLGHEKSEESYKEWEKYWGKVMNNITDGIINVTQGSSMDWKTGAEDEGVCAASTEKTSKASERCAPESERRWIFAMRHGERVDLTYGQWVPHCFDSNGIFVRKDLNMPLQLAERAGGAESYARDTPLTRVGQLQARLVGEGLRLAGAGGAGGVGARVRHVYASAALRCVETAHHFLLGLEADPSVKIRVEPGLFEFKQWYMPKGLAPFMTPLELHNAGYNVDLQYVPYVDLNTTETETLDDFYERNELVMHCALRDNEADGNNIIFVGHAATLDMMVTALNRLRDEKTEPANYQISKNLLRVPYCALAAMRDKPFEVVSPPCPPSINSSSGRYNWKMLLEL